MPKAAGRHMSSVVKHRRPRQGQDLEQGWVPERAQVLQTDRLSGKGRVLKMRKEGRRCSQVHVGLGLRVQAGTGSANRPALCRRSQVLPEGHNDPDSEKLFVGIGLASRHHFYPCKFRQRP